MHVDAVGAAVVLGGAQLDQMKQGLFKAALAEIGFESCHGSVSGG